MTPPSSQDSSQRALSYLLWLWISKIPPLPYLLLAFGVMWDGDLRWGGEDFSGDSHAHIVPLWFWAGATAFLIDHKGTHWPLVLNSLRLCSSLDFLVISYFFLWVFNSNSAHHCLENIAMVTYSGMCQLLRVEGNEGGLKTEDFNHCATAIPQRHWKDFFKGNKHIRCYVLVHHRWRRFSPAGILRGPFLWSRECWWI